MAPTFRITVHLFLVLTIIAHASARSSVWTDDFRGWNGDKTITDSISGKRYHGEFATDSVFSRSFECGAIPPNEPSLEPLVKVSYKIGLCPGLHYVDYTDDFVAVYTASSASIQARQSLVHIDSRAVDVLDTTGLGITCNSGAMEYEVPPTAVLPTTGDRDTLYFELALSFLAEQVLIYDITIECDENSQIKVWQSDIYAISGYEIDRYQFNALLAGLFVTMLCLNLCLLKYCCCPSVKEERNVSTYSSVQHEVYSDDAVSRSHRHDEFCFLVRLLCLSVCFYLLIAFCVLYHAVYHGFVINGYQFDTSQLNVFFAALLAGIVCLNAVLLKYCCCRRSVTQKPDKDVDVFSARHKVYCDDI